MFDLAAVLVTLAALFSYVNHRYIRLPTTIGVMVIALLFSLALLAAGKLGLGGLEQRAESIIRGIDFPELLMQGMLSLLLFAGALHTDLDELLRQKWVVGTLATVGVVTSTILVGTLTWLLLGLLDTDLPFVYCLLFGALIAPTDPIAVLGILKSIRAPHSLEVKIAGESLFNDGVAVVLFLVILGVATGGEATNAGDVALLFAEEALGGLAFGLVLGLLGYQLLKRVDSYQVEVLITLALVMGGYALATRLHVSGPLAMVVAGLCIGNQGRRFAMSARTREHLDTFWELVDEILNAVLFVLIGLEMLILTYTADYLLLGLLAIPVVLLARLIAVGIPVSLMAQWREFSPNVVRILTWGGLRGGISVALALSLPPGPERETIVAATYVVVVFSVVVQGLSVGPLIRASLAAGGDGPPRVGD